MSETWEQVLSYVLMAVKVLGTLIIIVFGGWEAIRYRKRRIAEMNDDAGRPPGEDRPSDDDAAAADDAPSDEGSDDEPGTG